MNFKSWLPFGEVSMWASAYLSTSFALICVILARVFPQEIAHIAYCVVVVTAGFTAACLIMSVVHWLVLPKHYEDRKAAVGRAWTAATDFRPWNAHRLIVDWVVGEWHYRKWCRSHPED